MDTGSPFLAAVQCILFWPLFSIGSPLVILTYKTEMSMSSTVIRFVHAIHKCVQKVPHANSGTFLFPWTDFHDSSFPTERIWSYTLVNFVPKIESYRLIVNKH